MKLLDMFTSRRAPALGQRSALAQYLASPYLPVREWWQRAQHVLGDSLANDLSAIRGSRYLDVLPQNFLLGDSIGDFAAEFRSGISEVVRWPLYYYAAYATAGQTQLQFFGSSAGNATNGYADTNMQQAGMMSGGEAHVVMAIRYKHFPATSDMFVTAGIAPAYRETVMVLENGLASASGNCGCWLEFRIGDKLYTQAGPLSLFPSGFGLGPIFSSTATSSVQSASVPQNGEASNLALWKQDPPTLILPSRTFNVTANWKGSVPVTNTSSGLTRSGVVLDGYRIRKVQ